MPSIAACLKIARPGNAFMAAAAAALGFYLGGSLLPAAMLAPLCIASMAAAAFGNVINDILDLATDCISHADRPLPRGDLTVAAARIYAAALAIIAIAASAIISPIQLIATLVPLCLLVLYSRFLKGAPVAGNLAVSLLVAYPLLYGALSAPGFAQLIIPATLAFTVNFMREVIKDLQDKTGDTAAGLRTTAVLSAKSVRAILYSASTVYLLMLPLPFLLCHFGWIYAAIGLGVILPLHLLWIVRFPGEHTLSRLALLSRLLKIEMALGLVALAADRFFLGNV